MQIRIEVTETVQHRHEVIIDVPEGVDIGEILLGVEGENKNYSAVLSGLEKNNFKVVQATPDEKGTISHLEINGWDVLKEV